MTDCYQSLQKLKQSSEAASAALADGKIGLSPDERAQAWAAALERAAEDGVPAEQVYVTGMGTVLMYVHERTDECIEHGCVIHNPTDPHTEFPTHWRWDRKLMERICPHGVGHPDQNAINFIRRTKGEAAAKAESVHGCDGCCAPHAPKVSPAPAPTPGSDLAPVIEYETALAPVIEYETARQAAVDLARVKYANPSDHDIEVDDDAEISIGEHGTWVQAWVFLRKPPEDVAD